MDMQTYLYVTLTGVVGSGVGVLRPSEQSSRPSLKSGVNRSLYVVPIEALSNRSGSLTEKFRLSPSDRSSKYSAGTRIQYSLSTIN